jgi:hypothetical protein
VSKDGHWFEAIEEMQAVLDAYMDSCNQRRRLSSETQWCDTP